MRLDRLQQFGREDITTDVKGTGHKDVHWIHMTLNRGQFRGTCTHTESWESIKSREFLDHISQ
jgi:hypothetical protein